MLADFYVDEPVISHWPWLAAVVTVAAGLAVAGTLVVRDVRRSREHDAELQARAERERAKLAAALVETSPAAPVFSGRHATTGFAAHRGNAGRHFADESPTREIRVDGSWRS